MSDPAAAYLEISGGPNGEFLNGHDSSVGSVFAALLQRIALVCSGFCGYWKFPGVKRYSPLGIAL